MNPLAAPVLDLQKGRRMKTKIVVITSSSDWRAWNLHVLRRLTDRNQLAEVMLFAWSQVERSVEWLVMWDFALEKVDDERTRILRDLPFWRKLSLLQKRGIIRKRDLYKIQTFQKMRNYLFHRGGKDVLELDIGGEKKKMMSNAVATVQAMYDAERRCLRKRTYGRGKRM